MKSAADSVFLGLLVLALAGCGGAAPTSAAGKPKPRNKPAKVAEDDSDAPAEDTKPKAKFPAVTLGGSEAGGQGAASAAKPRLLGEKRSQAIVAALQPLQVLLGQWRWTTNRKFDGSNKSAEDMEWIWDFKRDAVQPALTGKSAVHPYFAQIWITWLPEEEKYEATGKSAEGEERVFRGTWAEDGEPKEESDGKKIQHTYRLEMTQASPVEGEQWKLVFSQLDNNQYLMTMTRSPSAGRPFVALDVVRQQRLGTSFAVADSDNPGPKCIISGGLGTMNVTYNGKSYPVCCSGCAAAFNDDPEKWLAKLAEREKSKKARDD